RLAPVVGVDQHLLETRLSAHGYRFEYVARRVSDSVAARVKAMSLPGIGFMNESARSYPAGDLTAPILGVLGTDGTRLDGPDYPDDKTLTGKPGEMVVEQDQEGHDIPNTQRRRVEAVRGTDIVLTLDRDLQYEVETSLLDQVTATNALGGMAAVVDVTNG